MEARVRVLVVGSGGREHAIVSHLLTSSPSTEVLVAPGNPGIKALCPTFDIAVTDVAGLTRLALDNQVEIAIIGPEIALSAGAADALRDVGIAVLGPGADGARLETSKSWAKDLMIEAGIPTAPAQRFRDSAQALDYLRGRSLPMVVKADGLAAGKGAVVCRTQEEAERAVVAMLDEAVFSESGSTVLIEDLLVGEEYSMMIFTDGESLHPMPLSQDHKAIGDGDSGPNTGGMGAYAPVPSLGSAAEASIERIFNPLLSALKRRGIDYRGVITGNLIWTSDGPYVIEFNARFGDPEAEVTLPLLNTDLLEITRRADQRSLASMSVDWKSEWALCVVVTSAGYPGEVRTGDAIHRLDATIPGTTVFHAGTTLRDNALVTNGGRVLIATGTGASFAEARQRAYAAADSIQFEGKYQRSDIGWRAERYFAATSDGR
jgi:phosphoribosylamine--glycine ligase